MNPFHLGFMQRALVAGILVGTSCSILSNYIVLKNMSFIGHGISHVAFGGVALALLLGRNVNLITLAFSLLAALAIGLVSQRGKVSEDSAIGIFLVTGMALGVLFISLKKTYTPDVMGYLFGNILAVSWGDILLIVITGALVLGCVALFFKELFYFTFDEEMARVSGLPVTFIHYLLLGLIAVNVVIAIKVVGVILVSALLIIPATTAQQLTGNFRRMMAISLMVGLISNFGGLYLSYLLDIPSGSTIVLTLFFFFLTALAIRVVRGRGWRAVPKRKR